MEPPFPGRMGQVRSCVCQLQLISMIENMDDLKSVAKMFFFNTAVKDK